MRSPGRASPSCSRRSGISAPRPTRPTAPPRLEPNLSRTQTVRGFALLTEVHTAAAAEAFTRAIELDSADPLPRLGLGLAKVRDGHLDAGARDLEVAASLDPGTPSCGAISARSTTRRSVRASIRASTRWRSSSTRSIRRRGSTTPSRSRPPTGPSKRCVDFQKAIELNDNRAVYRLAVVAGLGPRRAQRQPRAHLRRPRIPAARARRGMEVGERGPYELLAHRFLADSYSVLPRHQIARVSELPAIPVAATHQHHADSAAARREATSSR